MPFKMGKLSKRKGQYKKILASKKFAKEKRKKIEEQLLVQARLLEEKEKNEKLSTVMRERRAISNELTKIASEKQRDGWCCAEVDEKIMVQQLLPGIDKQPIVKRCLIFERTLTWTMVIHGRQLSNELPQLRNFPSHVHDVETVKEIFTVLSSLDICAGNYEDDFTSLIEERGGTLGKPHSSPSAEGDSSPTYLEPYYAGVSKFGISYSRTVRSGGCTFFTEDKKIRCDSCSKSRDSLRRAVSRRISGDLKEVDRTSSDSKVNYRFLSKAEIVERNRNIQSENDNLRAKLRQCLKNNIETNGLQLKTSESKDFQDIMKESNAKVLSEFPEGSFKRIFWEEQCKANSSNLRGMRWHPAIIRWCLALKLQSSSGYEAMRSSGFVTLPSQRTLRDYTNYIKPETGVNEHVLESLVSEYDVKSLPDHKRYVVLLHDEMKLKSQLVYDKTTGELIGYVNLGSVNQELEQYEKWCSEQTRNCSPKPDLATHVLALMVRGVATDMKYCVAYYPTNGTRSDELFSIIWEAICYLEVSCGLKVIASTSDGATPNRRFYKLHRTPGVPNDFIIHKAINPLSLDRRFIYFFSDVPHLVKTTRNCWANSEAHTRTRSLWNNGQPILWRHLSDLVTRDQDRPIHLVNKIGWEHIHLTSFSIMRVNLAAQVLSQTVANAIEMYGPPEAGGTVQFVRMMDRFFDCLNVRSLRESHKKMKPDLAPYTDVADPRLTWLENDFLAYFTEWKESVERRPGTFTKKQMGAMCLSRQTLQGLTMSVKSFVEVCRFLLTEGVEFILSERFCQDSLEQHFSKHRQRGGANNDPTVQQFGYQENVIRLQRSNQLQCLTGNTGRNLGREEHTNGFDLPLPKRHRK